MPAGDLLVLSVEERLAKSQKPYLALKVRLPNGHPLRESSPDIGAKVWDNAIKKGEIPPHGRIISAGYKEDEWNGESQLIINHYTLRPADWPKDLFQLPPAVDQDVIYKKLFHRKWVTPEMNAFFINLRAMLDADGGKLKKKLYEVPAGAKNHHNRRAGLLQHVEEIWDFAVTLLGIKDPTSHMASMPHFPGMFDWEIVLAGIVMHDLGKTHEYNPETGQFEEDRIGAYFGHTCWGAFTVMQCWPADGDRERGMKLTHVVLSHHGSMQTGAAIEAKIPEASLVHLLDATSARMDVHRTAINTSKEGKSPGFSKSFGSTPITPTWPPSTRDGSPG